MMRASKPTVSPRCLFCGVPSSMCFGSTLGPGNTRLQVKVTSENSPIRLVIGNDVTYLREIRA